MSFSCTEAVVIVAAPAQKKSRKSLSFAQKLEAVAAYKLKEKSKLRQEEEERASVAEEDNGTQVWRGTWEGTHTLSQYFRSPTPRPFHHLFWLRKD
jgi:hypothetical protein